MSDIYHTLSRGVDKRKIFLDNQDYFRFIHNLFILNNQEVVYTTLYSFINMDFASPNIKTGLGKKNQSLNKRKPRKLLVDIYAFCLMPNHYHLLLSPKVKDGIPKFMKKLNMAYAKYFNRRYKRKGTLFESRYKFVLVNNEPHFYHLPYYIHLNPLDLKFPEWREGKLRSYRQALKFLEDYRWSSHLDYIGIKNFPSVTDRNFLIEVFEGTAKYKQSIEQWLKELELEAFKDLVLE